MELALGTVQFGLAYGVAGRGSAVPEDEVREILAYAAEAGIGTLDTAASYGDIEERLARLCDGLPFQIVSKIPAIQSRPVAVSPADFISDCVHRSRERLGDRLRAVLFHEANDLLDGTRDDVWSAAQTAASECGLDLGVSCYDPQQLLAVRQRYAVGLCQLPGNAFDQRLGSQAHSPLIEGIEIHLRSAFLQGLLLMPLSEAVAKVPAAGAALTRWHEWCRERGIDPLRGAFAAVKGIPTVRYVVVGVDRLEQLKQIVEAWRSAPNVADARELACEELAVIDPRRWRPE